MDISNYTIKQHQFSLTVRETEAHSSPRADGAQPGPHCPADDHLKDTPSHTTTTAKQAPDLGPMGLHVYSWGLGSHSSQQPTLKSKALERESPCGSDVLSEKYK